MDEKRLRKLPKWAQYEIDRLQKNLEYKEQRLAKMFGNEGTNTFIYEFDKTRPLPKDCVVQFNTGKKKIKCCVDRGRLYVHVSSSILIRPEAYNAVSIF